MQQADIERARRACTELSEDYARCLDFRDYDAFLTLFADAAVFDAGERHEGLAAIRDAMRQRRDEVRTRHVLSNAFVDVLGPDDARGIVYLTLYRHVGPESLARGPAPLAGPAAVGHYEDRFRRDDGVWRFASRRLQLAFAAEPAHAGPGAESW